MERPDVMDFELFRASAHLADWVKCKMLLANGGPVTGAFCTEGVFAFNGIDQVLEHAQPKITPLTEHRAPTVPEPPQVPVPTLTLT